MLPHLVVVNVGDMCTEDVVESEREEKSAFSGKGHSKTPIESVEKGVPTI